MPSPRYTASMNITRNQLCRLAEAARRRAKRAELARIPPISPSPPSSQGFCAVESTPNSTSKSLAIYQSQE